MANFTKTRVHSLSSAERCHLALLCKMAGQAAVYRGIGVTNHTLRFALKGEPLRKDFAAAIRAYLAMMPLDVVLDAQPEETA